ncbi:MAG: pyridoxal-phosphate dependent enzyme [Aeropyrum sp.]|nr:pyridoxal-phosphate dependent enzyme [Aeropyrum sp.]MCE4615712.1 pyridoxal-phosphate dependent enzyme [Aeropyrum sp.]
MQVDPPKPANTILDLIGNTPLVRLARLEKLTGIKSEVYAKLEYYNPGGSVKDRIGLYMIRGAVSEGLVDEGGVLIEPTSGNTGIGLALAAKEYGLTVVAVMPTKMSFEKEAILKALGAIIVRTPTSVSPDDPISYYNVAKVLRNLIWSLGRRPFREDIERIVSVVQEWIRSEDRASLLKALEMDVKPTPYAYIPNQYENKYNPLAHEETTARELLSQTGGRLDYVFAGMGTGGTITGIARYLKPRLGSRIKIVGVDPEGSIFHLVKKGMPVAEAQKLARTYKVEGIGEDIIPETIDLNLVDEIVVVDDARAFAMARLLARVEGLLAGGSSGAAVYAAVKYLKERRVRGKRAVVILPDTGRNYLSKFYDDGWMEENGFSTRDEEVLSDILG